jgi:hypothetical protein
LLRSQELVDKFVVFHNVAWLAQAPNGGAFGSEAGFLIAHLNLCVLVMEVKEGRIGYDGKLALEKRELMHYRSSI